MEQDPNGYGFFVAVPDTQRDNKWFLPLNMPWPLTATPLHRFKRAYHFAEVAIDGKHIGYWDPADGTPLCRNPLRLFEPGDINRRLPVEQLRRRWIFNHVLLQKVQGQWQWLRDGVQERIPKWYVDSFAGLKGLPLQAKLQSFIKMKSMKPLFRMKANQLKAKVLLKKTLAKAKLRSYVNNKRALALARYNVRNPNNRRH